MKNLASRKKFVWGLVCVCSFLLSDTFAIGEEHAVYLTDMSHCEPQDALSKQSQAKHWRLIPYKTKKLEGTMLGAGSYIDAPEVRLPTKQQGWYSIYLGVWNPSLMYDGEPIIKARLSSRPIFQQIHPGKSPGTQNATFLEEVHLCDADLSAEKYLAFGKSNGLQPRSAYIAYVKLVPLSANQVELLQKRRSNPQRRNLVATYDGSSIFHFSECSTIDHQLEWIEKLRDSDTKKVLWAVTYGDKTGFPTKNSKLTYLSKEDSHQPSSMTFGNSYQRGHRQMQLFFKHCEKQKVLPQQSLAKHAHRLGMKFDLMYRIGFLGGLGLSEITNHNLVQAHPEVRQVTHDGVPLQKASLASLLVQQLILEQIEESCQLIDADGINICFVRGPHFLLWEQPVRDAFEEKFEVSSENIAADDPRIKEVRAEIMTRFMNRVRAKIDELGKSRGRDYTLSVWVWPRDQGVWLGGRPLDEGLDVEQWIKLGLLQSVICQEGIDKSYVELGKQHDCEFVLFTGYRGERAMSPKTLLDAAEQGVSSFALWDIDAYQNNPSTWRWLRQTGNHQKLTDFKNDSDLLKRRLTPLVEINNIRVDVGLVDAIYSGG